jgi:hypothetical protein
MSKNVTRWGILALLLGAAACSEAEPAAGAGGSAGGSAVDCRALAEKIHGYISRCLPLALDTDKETFVSRIESECKEERQLDGYGQDAASCDLAALDCNAEENGPLPPECVPRGTLADGAPCAAGSQCAGGGCTAENICGQCFTYRKVGEKCGVSGSTEQCEPWLSCGDDGKCRARSKLGEPCDDLIEFRCESPLVCVSKTCVKPVGEGEDCTSLFECDYSGKGLLCDDATKKCKKVVPAKVGEACGVISGNYVFCESTAFCPNTGGSSDTCQIKKNLGESCSENTDQCLIGLFCREGTCTKLDKTSCK